jgi:hypothetical protein
MKARRVGKILGVRGLFFGVSQFQNIPFWPVSALGSNFNPQNTPCIPVVKIFARLDPDQTETF